MVERRHIALTCDVSILPLKPAHGCENLQQIQSHFAKIVGQLEVLRGILQR